MMAEIIPELYDVHGSRTSKPTKRKAGRVLFNSTFHMGRYLTGPLSHPCTDFEEIRTFLKQCRYASDKDQFGKDDYWMLPEHFEEYKRGDCEDFSLWTWRQLIGMGIDSRLVAGTSGKYGSGHAWLTAQIDGKYYLIEPQARFVGDWLPRLSAARYEPHTSVEWDGERLHYFRHRVPDIDLPLSHVPGLVSEWVAFWGSRRAHATAKDLAFAYEYAQARFTRWRNERASKD